MDGDRLRRRDVLRGIGGAGVVGTLGVLGTSGVAAARSAEARTGSNGGEVFMGGTFIELGIRANGGFGTDGAAPEAFYGSDRSESEGAIGMYADPDGFDSGETDRYEYFLSDEQFLVGYVPSGDQSGGEEGPPLPSIPTFQVNGVIGGSVAQEMPTITGPTVERSGPRVTSEITNVFQGGQPIILSGTSNDEGTSDAVLEIEQTHTLDSGDQYFRTDVTIENVSSEAVESARFARTVNPGRALGGCSPSNSVPSSGGGETLVKSAVGSGNCGSGGSPPPLYYYSTDERTRGFVDVIPPQGLYPDQGVAPTIAPQEEEEEEEPPPRGTD